MHFQKNHEKKMHKIPLVDSMISCKSCGLRSGCNMVVPAKGSWTSPIFIIGEAPGADEDILGRPFCGRSGQLLDKLLKEAGIAPESVFITNVVKCRPPANRMPTKDEISTCKKWLWEELKTVNPKIIITLGKTPTCLLLKLPTTITLGKLIGVGTNREYIPNSTVYPWYHPSFLLRKGGSYDKQTVDFLRRIQNESKR